MSVAGLPVGLVLVGAHYQLHLLVTQVIFVTAGTSHGFTAGRSADFKEGQSCIEPETPSLDNNALHCRALVGGGVAPCGNCMVLSGHRE